MFAVLFLAGTVAASSHPQRGPKHHIISKRRSGGDGPKRKQLDVSEVHRMTQELSENTNGVTAQLRSDLLKNYSRRTYPWESAWDLSKTSGGLRQGLPIELGINFHRIFEVDVASGVVDLIVWVRQQWHDPRLSWDPEKYGNITQAHFWIGDGTGPGGETSEIWTPDLELWNMESSWQDTLVNEHAVASSDGTVFWSRPGHMKVVCRFRGLERFPFDRLDCTAEVGSWGFSGLYIRPTKMNGVGFTIGGSDTAGQAFAEFSLEGIDCEEHLYPPYPNSPEDDWPVLFYHFTFARAWQPYARGYVVLQIVLNLAAFCCFWIPPQVGERMSLAITALLAAVASELVVAANLPSAAEMTWFAQFSIGSLFFAAAALFESAAVIYFYYHTAPDLEPSWWKYLRSRREANKKEANEKAQPPKIPVKQNKSYGDVQHQKPAPEVRFRLPAESSSSALSNSSEKNVEDVPGVLTRPSLLDTPHFQGLSTQVLTVGRDADDFKNDEERENNLNWQKVAHNIDEGARVIFPATFAIFVAALFAVT